MAGCPEMEKNIKNKNTCHRYRYNKVKIGKGGKTGQYAKYKQKGQYIFS